MKVKEARYPLLAVVGATGTGKSDLGVALAHRFNGEVVNADSMQFYRGMNIGTAKLSLAEREGVDHHLLDFLDVTDEASVAEYQVLARRCVADIQSRGKTPILVGGSGLYVRAAVDILEIPPTDGSVRRRLEALARSIGFEALHSQLATVDPLSAERIHDERRTVRALEVFELTGRPFSAFMPKREYVSKTVQIGLRMPRAQLRERLGLRVERMYRDGFVEEVRRLEADGLRAGRTAQRALGYQQILRSFDDHSYSLEQALADTVVATSHFAKRQETWFNADPRVQWFSSTDVDQVDAAVEYVESFVSKCQLSGS